MNATTTRALAGLGLLAACALAGCIERKEHISIRPDGSVNIKVEHTSDSWDEMYLGDAWPRLEGGWLATNSSEMKDDGKEEFHLEAEAMFPWGAELPSNYEIDKDPYPGTSTRFPTTLLIEERRDGTYYHFRRVYTARDWAYVGKIREQIEERIKKLNEPPKQPAASDGADAAAVQPRTPEQEQALQLEVIKALTDFETVKLQYFTERALADVAPDAPQDVFLKARAALRGQAAAIDFDRVAELLREPDDDMREKALDEEAKAFEQRADDAIEQSLRAGGWLGGSQIREFFRRLEWHREYYRITEELADDSFEITVAMPGEIVADNADDVSGNEAHWQVGGDMFRDRDVELMVTSRVR